MKGLHKRRILRNSGDSEKMDGSIGVFLDRSQWKRLRTLELSGGLEALTHAAGQLEMTLLWFTLPPKEQYHSGHLTGVLFRDGKFYRDEYPLPKVIYDRATFPKKLRREATEFRRYMSRNGVKFLNSQGAFSKWGTYKVLSKNSKISPHLPKTIHFCRTLDLEDLFQVYDRVYVKSNWGSRGKEVLALTQKESGYEIVLPNGSTEEHPCFSGVTQAIYRFLGNSEAIAQQGILLARWEENIFDVRVLAQKVNSKDWDCTGIVLRIASNGKKATNLSQGGIVLKAEPVLEELWPGKSQEILQAIRYLCIEICYTLEESYGALGELGLDIGVDENGGIWLIEVNGKPAKSTIRKLGREDLIQAAYQRPLIYAQRLLEGVQP